MNTTRRTRRENAREQGFSLVEMSIVLVIIGLIIAAVAAGQEAMKDAEALRAYQKVVVPCVSQAQASIARTNSLAAGWTPTGISAYDLDGAAVSCVRHATAANTVTIDNANAKLLEIMELNLEPNEEFTVSTGGDVAIYAPGDA